MSGYTLKGEAFLFVQIFVTYYWFLHAFIPVIVASIIITTRIVRGTSVARFFASAPSRIVSFIVSIAICAIMPVVSNAQDAGPAVVQVLAYDGQDLVNQGSGVYVDGQGTIVSAAHLLRGNK